MGKCKEVIKYDMNNNEICRYSSARVASEAENIGFNKFMKSVNKDKFIDGFKYCYSGVITNSVNKDDFQFKCPYCDEVFETYNGLCKHVFRYSDHKCESKEQLLSDFAYGGVRPKCKCGCGLYTDISYDGGAHFREYVLGHNSKITNNWGHNSQAILNSAQTRREQYNSGERIQWNKGKTWEEVYDEETIEKLLDTYKDENRKRKISLKLKGVPKSLEHKEKLKIVFNTNEYKECKRNELIQRIKNHKFSLSSQLELNFIDDFIKPLNIEYETQYYLKDIKQYCDVYIPSKNLVIECDGSFWHCDPRLFPKGAIYDYQKRKVERDEIKMKYLNDHGYKLLRFWELDILREPEYVKSEIEKHIIL